MSAITFDTLKYTKQLEEGGVERKQAEAQANAYKQSLTEVLEDFATKEDIGSLKKDADIYKSDVSTIKGDLKEVDKRLRSLEKETSNIRILLFIIMAAVVYPIIKDVMKF